MAKKKFVKERTNGRRGSDCKDCNKGQWNLHLKFWIAQGLSMVVIILALWGWADAYNTKENVQDNQLTTLLQMVTDDRKARDEQTKIIQRIEGIGNQRNLMIVQVAAKLGVEIDISKLKAQK